VEQASHAQPPLLQSLKPSAGESCELTGTEMLC
jgi:hypothetical protein